MLRVLFVDDDIPNLHAMQRHFGGYADGWEAAFVPGADVALFVMSERPVHAVVVSSGLSEMSAASFLRLTRERHPATARIALAGPGDRGHSPRTLAVANRRLSADCGPEVLFGEVRRVAGIQHRLYGDATRRLVRSVGALPSPPTVVMALDAALGEEDCSPAEVADIVSGDVAIVANVLKLVNSAYFGLRAEVHDLRQAVAYLGVEALRDLAIAGALFRAFAPGTDLSPEWLDCFNAHAAQVAGLASQMVPPPLRAEAHVAGMLHGIGELVVAERSPDRLAEVAADIAAGATPDEAEERQLGTTYPVVGGYLLSSWGMGYNLVEAVTSQRRLYLGHPRPAELADVIRVADDLVARLPATEVCQPPVCQASSVQPLVDGYAERVGLGPEAGAATGGMANGQ